MHGDDTNYYDDDDCDLALDFDSDGVKIDIDPLPPEDDAEFDLDWIA